MARGRKGNSPVVDTSDMSAEQRVAHFNEMARKTDERRKVKRDRMVKQVLRQARIGCQSVLENMANGKHPTQSVVQAAILLASEALSGFDASDSAAVPNTTPA